MVPKRRGASAAVALAVLALLRAAVALTAPAALPHGRLPQLDLSVVLCGRNDGHAADARGDFALRLQRTVGGLLLGLCQRRVRAEVVVVEYRAPNNTRRLAGLLRDFLLEEFVSREGEYSCNLVDVPPVRVIRFDADVSDAAMRSIGGAPHGGVLEWYCKNVGIRRAVGDMVLTMNADDLLSHALLDVLALIRHLRRDTFYIAQTMLLDFLVTKRMPVNFYTLYEQVFASSEQDAEDQKLKLVSESRAMAQFSQQHNLCGQTRTLFAQEASRHGDFWRSYDATAGLQRNSTDQEGNDPPRNFFDPYVGDFLLASRVAWRRISGAPMLLQSWGIDHLVACRFAFGQRMRKVLLMAPCFVVHQNHPPSMRLRRGRPDREPEWRGRGQWHRCETPLRPFPSEAGLVRRHWGFPNLQLPESRCSLRSGHVDVEELATLP